MMARLMVIVGATGAQGGSVVEAFLKRDDYKLRGITRNVKSEKAKRLASRGVEMVTADVNDEASLVSAFEGASVIFALTDFWERFDELGPAAAMDLEARQGLNLARAASRTPTLEHYLWSTLVDGKAASGGKYIVPHFESKTQASAFIAADAALLRKTTFVLVGWYASNLTYPCYAPNLLASSGKYAWILPVSPDTPMIYCGDHHTNVGRFIEGVVARPELTLPGKTAVLFTDQMPLGEFLKLWGHVTGRDTEFIQVSLDQYDRLWPSWGREMGMMMQYFEEAAQKGWGADDEIITAQQLGVEGLDNSEEAFRRIQW